MADESFRRLRTVLKPKTYDLTISPNLIKNTFTGLVYIFCDKNNLENENNLVELNSVDLNINKLLFNNEVQQVSHDTPNQRIFFTPKNILVEKNVIEISFTGLLNTKSLEGFYRIKHEQSEAKAVTQFCAIDARRCFPCFDQGEKAA